ncbi:hypothetical protein H6P81_001811 [Aristolochia fimbriata]|uniref:Protein kinase domain-containing protein n=1 Tax=Aristolochia fimbriata TaxID=158543 RepID=A0AAV7F8M0_ARIFI|nr:hypothetical protein H6P81_001811 [Aristolochia fimbriata]
MPTMVFFKILFLSLVFFFFFFSLSAKSQKDATIITSTDPSYYYKLCSNYSCSNISLRYPFGLQSFCGHPDLKTTCVDDDHIELYSNRIAGAEPCRIIGDLVSDPAGITIPVAFMSLFGCGHVTRKNFVTDPTHFTLSKEYTLGLHLNCTRRPASAPPGSLRSTSCLNCNGTSTDNVCFYSREFNNYAECEYFLVDTTAEVNVSAVKDLRGFLRNRGHKIRYTTSTSCRSCETSGGRCGSSTRGDFVCFCPSSVHRLNCSDGMIEDLRTWLPRDRKHKISNGATAAVSASASLLALIVIATTIVLCVIRTRRAESKKGDDENGDHDNKFKSEDANHVNALIDGISPTRYTYSQIKKFTSNFSVKLGEGGFGTVYKGFIEGNGAVAVKLLKKSAQKEKQFMNEVATVGRIHHHNLVGLLGYCAHRSTRALIYEFIENGSLNKCYIPADDQSTGGKGKKTNTDSRDENTSLFYFPEWVFKKAEKGELKRILTVSTTTDQEGSGTGTEVMREGEGEDEEEKKEEDEIWEKMCMVGLWCIQHVPSNRPNMRKVIQMLEGMNNEIEMPPNPFPEGFNGDDFLSLHFTAGASNIKSSDK